MGGCSTTSWYSGPSSEGPMGSKAGGGVRRPVVIMDMDLETEGSGRWSEPEAGGGASGSWLP